MKKTLLLLATLLSWMSVRATNLTLDSVMRLGLPVVVIQTQNNVMPTVDAVHPPAGCIGNSITNATKVPGRFWFSQVQEIRFTTVAIMSPRQSE